MKWTAGLTAGKLWTHTLKKQIITLWSREMRLCTHCSPMALQYKQLRRQIDNRCGYHFVLITFLNTTSSSPCREGDNTVVHGNIKQYAEWLKVKNKWVLFMTRFSKPEMKAFCHTQFNTCIWNMMGRGMTTTHAHHCWSEKGKVLGTIQLNCEDCFWLIYMRSAISLQHINHTTGSSFLSQLKLHSVSQ